mgnify:CR=1 FL=1
MLINANGIQMNYELSGKKKASVVILSHSLGCSLTMWDPHPKTQFSRSPLQDQNSHFDHGGRRRSRNTGLCLSSHSREDIQFQIGHHPIGPSPPQCRATRCF